MTDSSDTNTPAKPKARKIGFAFCAFALLGTLLWWQYENHKRDAALAGINAKNPPENAVQYQRSKALAALVDKADSTEDPREKTVSMMKSSTHTGTTRLSIGYVGSPGLWALRKCS